MYLVSGLAVNDGSHSIFVNEVDKVNLTYKLYRIEARIRILARRFPESHVCLFASALQSSLLPVIAQEVLR
jgi:hypothetical protein